MRAERGRLRRALHRLWRDREGAAILEFALVLPPLCLILIGMFEVAMVTFCQASMEGALREAARYGMTGQDNATPEQREAKILELVDEYTLGLFAMDSPDLSITYKIYNNFNNVNQPEPLTYDANGNGRYDAGDQYTEVNGEPGWQDDMGEAGLGAAEQIVEYTVEYDWPVMTPLMKPIMGNADGKIPLKASIVLRNEPWNVQQPQAQGQGS